MAVHGLHFDQIYNSALRDIDLRVPEHVESTLEIINDKRHHVGCQYTLRHPTITIKRTVTISQIDLEDKFKVVMEEALVDPFFITSLEERVHCADDDADMDFLYRLLQNFVTKEIEPNNFPSREMVAHVDKINSDWFTDQACQALLYLVSDEFGDEWKIKLTNKNNKKEVYAEYLPLTTDGVTCKTIFQAYNTGFEKGRVCEAATIAENLARIQISLVLSSTAMRAPSVREILEKSISSNKLSQF